MARGKTEMTEPQAETGLDPAVTQTPEVETPEDAALLDQVEATDPAEAAASPDPVPPGSRKRGAGLTAFVALVLGGAIAAGAGFALARFVPDLLPLPGTTAEIAALRDQIAALPQPDRTLPDRLAALETSAAQLADRVSALEQRPAAGAGPADPDLSARIQALQDQVANLSAAAPVPADVTAAMDQVEARLKQAQDQAAALAEQATATAAAARRAAALSRIAGALDSGAPYASALADLPDLPAPLADHAASGLPSLAELRETFPPAARAALEAALRANMGESWSDRVASFLRSQTGLRSLTPRDGDDPDAILSRAEAALTEGRLADALAQLQAMPDAARPALADWLARAQLRVDAEAALSKLNAG